uniref:Uncharacterized protein n=1 Tax=Oryza sativa subsp. japonica TaxID=39947 RepID=Q5TKD5_ORYSJ|nr:unknown protein [Oryza sativa Japonica Group]
MKQTRTAIHKVKEQQSRRKKMIGEATHILVGRLRRDGGVIPAGLLVDAVGGAVEDGVEEDDDDADEQRGEDVDGGAGEEEEDEGEHGEHRENGALPDGAAAERERLVAEEVEEEPGDHAGEEDDEGDRVPEQGEEHHGEHHDGVVHGEVAQVGARAAVRAAEPARHGRRPRVGELPPRPPLRQRRRAARLGAGDEVERGGGGGARGRPVRGRGGRDGAILRHGAEAEAADGGRRRRDAAREAKWT